MITDSWPASPHVRFVPIASFCVVKKQQVFSRLAARSTAISCLGAFRPPATGTRGQAIIPAAENLHTSGLVHRTNFDKKNCTPYLRHPHAGGGAVHSVNNGSHCSYSVASNTMTVEQAVILCTALLLRSLFQTLCRKEVEHQTPAYRENVGRIGSEPDRLPRRRGRYGKGL